MAKWTGGVGTAVALGITILLAHLSYQLYERPFLRLKGRFTFVPSRDDVRPAREAVHDVAILSAD